VIDLLTTTTPSVDLLTTPANTTTPTQGRQYILRVLEQAAIRSKEAMRSGKEPACLLDFWTQQILAECAEAAAAGTARPKYSTNKEMAYVVKDFLFASQVCVRLGAQAAAVALHRPAVSRPL
jgi:hypothetical protein